MKNITKQSPLKQKLFHYALTNARARNALREMGRSVPVWAELQHRLFDRLVFAKIRERLGGNLQCMASGGAACPRNVLEFFDDINIPILEGYGLTETAPIISASGYNYDQRRLGTVGVVLPGQDVRIIDPDSAALVRISLSLSLFPSHSSR
jgi:long-chain acyl-CoA synthetase